jgi:hypothetical protein
VSDLHTDGERNGVEGRNRPHHAMRANQNDAARASSRPQNAARPLGSLIAPSIPGALHWSQRIGKSISRLPPQAHLSVAIPWRR